MTVELDQLLVDNGKERRLDSHKLVLYLGQLTGSVKDVADSQKQLADRFVKHMEAEEKNQKSTQELTDLLRSFKLVMKIGSWASVVIAGAWAALAWMKEHVRW